MEILANRPVYVAKVRKKLKNEKFHLTLGGPKKFHLWHARSRGRLMRHADVAYGHAKRASTSTPCIGP